jgi:hypothetical protein
MTLSTIEGGSNMSKGGPATQEGKEVVKWNSMQHGICSPAPVVPGIERTEAWEEHRERHPGESAAGGTPRDGAGRKGCAALLAAAPRHAF